MVLQREESKGDFVGDLTLSRWKENKDFQLHPLEINCWGEVLG
jgi:hypothetical protein